MSKSKIEWTDVSWNPVTGCDKVSPGCKNCYAETIAKRFWGERKFTDVRLHPKRLEQPLHWREPRLVFVNSMSDLFHPNVPFEFIDRVFTIMALGNWNTYQILTKRIERAKEYFQSDTEQRISDGFREYLRSNPRVKKKIRGLHDMEKTLWPLENVWLGVSIESPDYLFRIKDLIETSAAVRFLSLEPLLAAIPNIPLEGVSWVIVGGESGTGARPCNIYWIGDIVKQCQRADVPVFVKQLGANPTFVKTIEPNMKTPLERQRLAALKGNDPSEWPEDLRIRQFPISR